MSSILSTLTDKSKIFRFFPDIVSLNVQDNGAIVLTDQGGNIVTHSEWKQLRQSIDQFYKSISANELESAIKEREAEKESARREIYRKPEHKTTQPGFVYLIKSEHGQCKIGMTKNLDQRMTLFGIKLPFKFDLVHSIKSDDIVGLEKSLHTKYADKRLNGEWFDLTDQDVSEIRSMQ